MALARRMLVLRRPEPCARPCDGPCRELRRVVLHTSRTGPICAPTDWPDAAAPFGGENCNRSSTGARATTRRLQPCAPRSSRQRGAGTTTLAGCSQLPPTPRSAATRSGVRRGPRVGDAFQDYYPQPRTFRGRSSSPYLIEWCRRLRSSAPAPATAGGSHFQAANRLQRPTSRSDGSTRAWSVTVRSAGARCGVLRRRSGVGSSARASRSRTSTSRALRAADRLAPGDRRATRGREDLSFDGDRSRRRYRAGRHRRRRRTRSQPVVPIRTRRGAVARLRRRAHARPPRRHTSPSTPPRSPTARTPSKPRSPTLPGTRRARIP